MTHYIILAVIGIQIFFAGCFFESQFDKKAKFEAKSAVVCLTAATICFGWLIAAVLLLINVVGWLHRNVWNGLHLTFLIKYVLFGCALDFNADTHQAIKMQADKLHPRCWNFNQRIFKWCVAWIDRNYSDVKIITGIKDIAYNDYYWSASDFANLCPFEAKLVNGCFIVPNYGEVEAKYFIFTDKANGI